MLRLLHEKVISFNGSILGFEDYNEFYVTVVEEGSPYVYLQSSDDENIGFLVVMPYIFYPEYTFEIDEKDKTLLDIKSHEEVAVLNTVTIREPFTKSTVNLLAPLVLNLTSNKARQIVLPPKTSYETNAPLFRTVPEESGE